MFAQSGLLQQVRVANKRAATNRPLYFPEVVTEFPNALRLYLHGESLR